MTVRINGKRRSLNRVIGLGIVILILGLVYHVCTLHIEKSEAVQTVQTLKQETNALKEEKSSIVEEKTQVENELESVRISWNSWLWYHCFGSISRGTHA